MTTNTDWIEWAGGECPVRIEIKYRNGISHVTRAPHYEDWSHEAIPNEGDIIAYRIVKP